MLLLKTKAGDRILSIAAARLLRRCAGRLRIRMWRRRGCPFRTPHAYKQQLVCDCARQYGLRLFVETGTQYGDMLFAVQHAFERLYSIELHPGLFAHAKRRFSGNPRVHLVEGDSADRLPQVLAGLDGPALFFLDAHFFRHGISGRGKKDSPVLEELAAVLADSRWRHVILIDDAHCFTPERGFPGLDKLCSLVAPRQDLVLTVAHDIIRILPKNQPLREMP